MLTYLGKKRSLLGQIGGAVKLIKRRLGKERLRTLDAFSGSGVVSRYLKQHSKTLFSNDLEQYAAVVGRCYLSNRSAVDLRLLRSTIRELNRAIDNETLPEGFIRKLYSPRDELNIGSSDRVFYTQDNARRLDDYRRRIEQAPSELHDLLPAPLLSRASVHANTAGVFKGFYKDSRTGVGRFGGTGADALSRIRGKIVLDEPVRSAHECEAVVIQGDINETAESFTGLDLAYLAPPTISIRTARITSCST